MSILVKWGRERLHVPLPAPTTKLGALRHTICDLTGLEPKTFKLIHAGGIMKDDNASIADYRITERSVLAIVGGTDKMTALKRNEEPERPTEQGTINKIHSELETIRHNLGPSVEAFLDEISSVSQPDASPDLRREHTRLGEMLLQGLLRLDAIITGGEWEDARRERKGAVKEVQGLLDRLDLGWRQKDAHQ